MVFFPLLQGSSLLLGLLQGGFFTLWLKWMKNWSNWGILLPCAECLMVTKCLWNAVAVALSVWAGITPLTLPGLFIIPVAVLPPGPGILPLLGTDVLHLGHYFLSIFFIIIISIILLLFLFSDFHDPSNSAHSLILRFCPLSFQTCAARIKTLPGLGLISFCVPRFVTNISHS